MEQRRRVLFVCASGGGGRLQLGGAERFLSEILPALSSTLSVGAVVSDQRIAVELRGKGVWVTEARPEGKVDLKYCKAIRQAAKTFAPDVVSVHLLSSSVHARLCQLQGPKLAPRMIVTLHNSMMQYLANSIGLAKFGAFANLAIERLFRLLVNHDSVAVSQFEEKELKKAHGRGQIHLIYNALPRSWVSPVRVSQQDARDKTNLACAQKILLYVGRLEEEKGADRLQDVIESLPRNWILVTVGEGVIRPQGERVLHVGHVKDPSIYYRAADVVIVPSRVESFGRVALEAACSGVPVVHTNVGGLAEVLAGQDGGLSWPAEPDARSLSSAVLAAETFFASHTDNLLGAAENLSARFSFETMKTRWLELLENRS